MKKIRRSLSKLLSIILLVCVVVGLVFGIGALAKFINKKTKTVLLTYEVGALDTTGEYVENNSAIYSNKFECQGLTITPDFDSNVYYEVHFYDFDDKFLGVVPTSDNKNERATGVKTFDTVTDTEDAFYGKGYYYHKDSGKYAKTCRIVIYPCDDDNVTIFEIIKYSSVLKVEVNKTQKNLKNISAS